MLTAHKITMKRIFLFLTVLFSLFTVYAQSANLNLITESEKLGATVYWDSLSGAGLLEKNGHQISFRAGDSFVLQDFKKLALTDAPIITDGMSLKPSLTARTSSSKPRRTKATATKSARFS